MPRWKKTARARKISKKLKAYHARVRRIAEAEGITYSEARKIQGKTFIHAVQSSGERFTARYMAIGRDPETGIRQWRKLQKGMPAKRIFTEGRILTPADVQRARSVGLYHAMIREMAVTMDKPLKEVKRMFRDFRETMEDAMRFRKLHNLPGPKTGVLRARDIAAVIRFSDRYPKLRERYGI